MVTAPGTAGPQPSRAIALDPPVIKEDDKRLILRGWEADGPLEDFMVVLMPATSTWGSDGAFLRLIRLERKM